eukprot:CCRYP_003734-RA/>CCRYP_003734-RA protein AED:0.18 eAED:0.53 QI:0/0/0.5/1/0/0/2/465/273
MVDRTLLQRLLLPEFSLVVALMQNSGKRFEAVRKNTDRQNLFSSISNSPVPGGPNNKMPDLLLPSNSSGYFKGNSTASMISSLTVDNPPISSHRTLGNEVEESGIVLEPPEPRDDCVKVFLASRSASSDFVIACTSEEWSDREVNVDLSSLLYSSSFRSFSIFHSETNFSLKNSISLADSPTSIASAPCPVAGDNSSSIPTTCNTHGNECSAILNAEARPFSLSGSCPVSILVLLLRDCCGYDRRTVQWAQNAARPSTRKYRIPTSSIACINE